LANRRSSAKGAIAGAGVAMRRSFAANTSERNYPPHVALHEVGMLIWSPGCQPRSGRNCLQFGQRRSSQLTAARQVPTSMPH
jgi:hypothetical protein